MDSFESVYVLKRNPYSRKSTDYSVTISIQPEPLIELKQWLSFFEQYWDEKLAILKEFVEADKI